MLLCSECKINLKSYSLTKIPLTRFSKISRVLCCVSHKKLLQLFLFKPIFFLVNTAFVVPGSFKTIHLINRGLAELPFNDNSTLTGLSTSPVRRDDGHRYQPSEECYHLHKQQWLLGRHSGAV